MTSKGVTWRPGNSLRAWLKWRLFGIVSPSWVTLHGLPTLRGVLTRWMSGRRSA